MSQLSLLSEMGSPPCYGVGRDSWLQGKIISVLAPNFNNLIPKRAIKQHSVSQVLAAWRWVNAINIALTVQVLTEYLQFGIWWKSCTCSSRSLINTSGGPHCLAPILANQPTMPISLEQSFLLEENLQHLGSIAWCKFFVWLAINNWCWTVDRLAKRGLPHPAAWPSCDQAEDTIQHVLTLCVFSWRVWSLILQKWGLITIAPQQTASCFSSWWCSALKGVPQKLQNVLDFLIILEAWEIWKHKSDYVFNG